MLTRITLILRCCATSNSAGIEKSHLHRQITLVNISIATHIHCGCFPSALSSLIIMENCLCVTPGTSFHGRRHTERRVHAVHAPIEFMLQFPPRNSRRARAENPTLLKPRADKAKRKIENLID